jgi:homocitrate synthase NifV
MTHLFQEMTGQRLPRNKPVLGEGIFAVESGIHVDGISKQPKCYEPFPPEVVGQARSIVIGKQSGKASIAIKIKELGFELDGAAVSRLLSAVKEASVKKNDSLTDAEFLELAKSI